MLSYLERVRSSLASDLEDSLIEKVASFISEQEVADDRDWSDLEIRAVLCWLVLLKDDERERDTALYS